MPNLQLKLQCGINYGDRPNSSVCACGNGGVEVVVEGGGGAWRRRGQRRQEQEHTSHVSGGDEQQAALGDGLHRRVQQLRRRPVRVQVHRVIQLRAIPHGCEKFI